MAGLVKISIDASQFITSMTNVTAQTASAIASGVNRAIILSRDKFAEAAAHDASGNVTQARVKKQISAIRRASPGSLQASFTVRGAGWDKSGAVLAYRPGNQYKPGSTTMASWVDTGGGSNPLSGPFFVITSNGGKVVLQRLGVSASGVKIHNGRAAKWTNGRSLKGLFVKKIYGENPRSAMEQEASAPRKVFDETARIELAQQVGIAVQRVIEGGSAGSD